MMGTAMIPNISEMFSQEERKQDMLVDLREDSENLAVNSGFCDVSTVTPTVQMNNENSASEEMKHRRSLRLRNGSYYGMHDIISNEALDEQSCKVHDSKHCRKGSRSPNKIKCEKARRPIIDEAPVFYPTEEEFKDTIGYISKIRCKAEQYGICRIIPPPSWSPPCPLKEKNFWECEKFTTRVQQVDKLQNRGPMRKKSRNHCQRKKKRRKRLRFGMTPKRNSSKLDTGECVGSDTEEKFGFQIGSDFTLEMFQTYADDFKRQYFGVNGCNEKIDLKPEKKCQPSVEEIEGEYWRIVEEPTEEIEVHYGADLDTTNFGSGFAKALNGKVETDQYVFSGWNLNNLPRLSGSILSFENEDISGVLVPWLYVGMCFSSFCWHVEDHHLYSLNYMHFGEPKVWYGVPGHDAVKLEDAMRKHLPYLFEEQPDLLHELVTQLSPSVLKSEDIPVYRVIQNAGEFVLTFPRAYHAGFNCGFNCAEAVNVAPVDWLPLGQCAVELYSEQHRKTSLSHDKLLFGAAREAVKELLNKPLIHHEPRHIKWQNFCREDGLLTQAVKESVVMEQKRRAGVSCISQVKYVDKDFDTSSVRECAICFYDLHMSAVYCECSPNRFSCLTHENLLCLCEPSKKTLLVRYELDELKAIVEVLEGKLNAAKLCRLQNSEITLPTSSTGMKFIRDTEVSCQKTITQNDRSIGTCANNQDCNQLTQGFGLQYIGNKSFTHFTEPGCTFKDTEKNHCSDLPEAFVAKRESNGSPIKGGPNSNREFVTATTVKPEIDMLQNDSEHKDSSPENISFCLLKGKKADSHLSFIDLNTRHFSEAQEQGSRHEEAAAVSEVTRQERSSDGSLLQQSSNFMALAAISDGKGERKMDLGDAEHPRNSSLKLFGIDISRPYSSVTVTNGPANQLFRDNVVNSCPLNQSNHVMDNNALPKYHIEPLNFGKLMLGKQWCSKQAIFPNGFKSRVAYPSILDPTRNCNYISEVLDGGPLGPLFKITVENNTDVSFTSTSALECWEIVQERLSIEIQRQHNVGKQGLPHFLIQESINGLEMFGFSSPSIIQAIESLDPCHWSTEYWASKMNSFELAKKSGCYVGPSGLDQKSGKLFGVDLTKVTKDSPSYLEWI